MNFKNITPFKGWVLENFPFIEADFDAITNYQLISKIIEYLNNIFNNENIQNESIIELKNRLDNLVIDISEEVNAKLDEMVEDGTLENLLNNKLMLITTYDTFSDVIDNKSSLVVGEKIKTLGYYSINDGGSAIYEITDETNSGEYYESLDDNLFARLINNGYITPEMIGCYGDNLHDDGERLVNLKYFSDVLFAKDKTYLSSKTINLDTSCHINLNGSTVKMYDRISETSGSIFELAGNNIILENGILIGDLDSRNTYPESIHGIRIDGNNIEIKNLKISKCCADGITTRGNDVSIHNIDVSNCGRNNISMLMGKNVKMYNIYTHDNERVNNPGHGIDIEPYADNQEVDNLEIYNIFAKGNGGSGINLSFYNDVYVNASVHDVYLENVFSLKLNNNPRGNLYINNVKLKGKQFTIQDPCSENFSTYIENVDIINHIPTTTSSYWGSAMLIRTGVSYTGDIYNLYINDINILGGESTYGVYVNNAGSNVYNTLIKNISCNRSDIQAFTGGGTLTGLQVEKINSKYTPTLTGNSITISNFGTIINANSTNNAFTIANNFPYRDYINLNNIKGTELAITSYGNNNYGTTTFRIPAYSSCKFKVNSDNTVDVESNRTIFKVDDDSNIDLNGKDITDIVLVRSTHHEFYKVYGSTAYKIYQDSATGGTITITNGIINVANAGGSTITICLDK